MKIYLSDQTTNYKIEVIVVIYSSTNYQRLSNLQWEKECGRNVLFCFVVFKLQLLER